MVNLLPYALAGAAAGAGEGLVQQAKQNFQAMQEELRNQRQVARDEANRTWQTGEREAGQEFRTTEAATEAGRTTDRFQDNEGNWWVRPKDGAKATPLVDKTTGQQLAGKAPRDPNELTKQQQLGVYQRALKDNTVKNQDDPRLSDQTDWGGVISDLKVAGVPITPNIVARAERDVRQQLVPEVKREADRRRGEDNLIMPDKPADYGGLPRDQWEKQELDRRVNERLVELGLADPQAMPQTQQAAAGTTPGQSQPGDTGKPPPAPIDPGQRTVGEVYFTPLKGPMKWMGNGWQAVQ